MLYAEGETSPKMMSVGLHCRLVGRPGRAAALMRFLDYIGQARAGLGADPVADRAALARQPQASSRSAAGFRMKAGAGQSGSPDVLGDAIVSRINELAAISETPKHLTRIFLTPEHRAAADLLLGWMRDAGMSAHQDAIGNVCGRYEGELPGLPCLMLGSHYDTVRDAGKWDGPLGVITAIACVADLHRRGGRLPFAVEVIGFADEEGVRFSSTLLGSRAVAGTFDASVLNGRDRAGISMREALAQFGLDPLHIGAAARTRRELHAYVELHIEQGPVLEQQNLAVGVVTAIAGATRLAVSLTGMAGHAGTVPMALRRDALAGAAECIAAIEAFCKADDGGLVGTVGYINAAPGATNVIPGQVSFTIDMRAPTDAPPQVRRRRNRPADRSHRKAPGPDIAGRCHPREPHRAMRALAEGAGGGRGRRRRLSRVRTAERGRA